MNYYERFLEVARFQTRNRFLSGEEQSFSSKYFPNHHGRVWKITKEEYLKVKKIMDELILALIEKKKERLALGGV